VKIKFTLQPSGKDPVDLLATVDAAATVGDLARYLVRAQPSHPASTPVESDETTLSLLDGETRVLDPRDPIGESGLHSGSVVSLSRAGQAYRDPHAGAAATLIVTAGPDTGREFPLSHGTSVLGRERGCEVKFTDPMVSRAHARLNVTDVIELVDLGSANGIQLGDATVTRTVLRPGDTATIGDSSFTVKMLQPSRHTPGIEDAAVAFVRSPRLDPHYEGQKFTAPSPPEKPGKQRFPIIALIAPLMIGAFLYVLTKSPTSLVFVALSPIMMVGNAVESRIGGRKEFRKALELWRADLREVVDAADVAAGDEIAGRNLEHPSLESCLDAVLNSGPLIWSRRPEDPGFLELNLGSGSQPSRNTIELPDAGKTPRELTTEMLGATDRFKVVSGVPVVAYPAEQGSVGFAGGRRTTLEVAWAFIAQVAILHSPAELVICGVASTQSSSDWNWIKWLPHTSSPHSPLPVRHLASTESAAAKLLSELEDLLAQRREQDNGEGSLPAVLVLVEHDAPAEQSRLVQLSEEGWRNGIHFVWLASDVTQLPAACRTFVELDQDPEAGSVGFVHTSEHVAPVALDSLTAETAADVARRLAPMVDIGARVDDDSDLPRAVSLLSVMGTQLASSSQAVVERWLENRSILTGRFAPAAPARHAGNLRAVIGQSAGEPLALDLRADGPHALVGGTTGSGKSELLQAWILAMAAAHSPQRLTFLLVDYKGGSAFRDCTELPHTIGLVTDLSPHLVRRALTSLSAELRFREHLLARHAAKDLVTLEKQGVIDAPPSLVIVVDEFAALVNEVPEFVDGVVNVAQRGRSLGLHLILATQRPAGVIKDNLRANTNLRVALRMADEDDSTDVLGSPQAAFFDQSIPGRAVSKTGPGRLVPFQTGYAGGWTTDEAPPPEIFVEELTFGTGPVWEADEEGEVLAGEQDSTDIKRLVTSVSEAFAMAEIPTPRKPWLPELKAVYDLANQDEVPSRRRDTELVFGIRDDPDNQSQPTVAFHPDKDGNLAVYGTGGSGKSTLLRTLAIASGFTVRGGPCHVYGIDFGARGLSMLEDLPHVGSIISGSDDERITRLLVWLRSLVDERAVRYSQANAATITDYRRLANMPDESRILLLVDGIAAFRQAYEASNRTRWFDMFTSLAADGRPVGVHVVLSSDQRSGMTTSLASAVQSRVILRQASEDDYGLLGVATDVLSASSPPGRGLVGEDETQIAVLGGTPDSVDQAVAIRGFAESMRRAGASIAPPIERLADDVALSALPASVAGLPVIGLSSTTLGPLPFEPRGTFIVSGPPGSGRTTTLHALVQSLRRWNPDIALHYFGNRRSSLASLPEWSTIAFGPDEVAEGASELITALKSAGSVRPLVAIFVEGVSDFVNGVADSILQDLARLCVAEEHFIVMEGETTTFTGSFGVLGAAKSSRAGIALAPDQSDGTTVYRTDFPRTNRAEFSPGRALCVALGKTEIVQIGRPDVSPV
jgi:S-DNA-T family DNA segregation ATPase FtsK/SpoIIIE